MLETGESSDAWLDRGDLIATPGNMGASRTSRLAWVTVGSPPLWPDASTIQSRGACMSDPTGSTKPPCGQGTAPGRKCGRCRQTSAADPHHVDGTIADWWLCDRCRLVLLGDRHAPDRAAGS
jgi:hypothetical protein